MADEAKAWSDESLASIWYKNNQTLAEYGRACAVKAMEEAACIVEPWPDERPIVSHRLTLRAAAIRARAKEITNVR